MITSTSNTRIKNVRQLLKSAAARKAQKSFVVEGPRMFFEVPPGMIREVYLTEDFEANHLERLRPYRYELISDGVCRSLSDTRTPQGILAVVGMTGHSLEELLQSEDSPAFVILEHIQDPGNIGTILRTAEAAGITGIILSRDCADIYSPKVIRSTMGAVFRIPFLVADDFDEMINKLKDTGVTLFGAHLSGEIYYAYDYRKPCAFLIGNEGNGLRPRTAALADELVRIPMEGQTESLNAGVAASLIMYEVLRQRKWGA